MGRDWEVTLQDRAYAEHMYAKELIDPLTDQAMFRGGIYCVLSPRETYGQLLFVCNSLRAQNIDNPQAIIENPPSLAAIVKAEKRRETLVDFASSWVVSSIPGVIRKDADKKKDTAFTLRDAVVNDFPGMGYKCASMFLRMCGYNDLVPVDRWMLRYLEETGYAINADEIQTRRGITTAEYLRFETAIADEAAKHGMTPGLFQIALWCKYSNWNQNGKKHKHAGQLELL